MFVYNLFCILTGCTAIGFDVSPPCIALANQIANEEGLSQSQCYFFEVDATIDPERLLAGKH